MRIVGRDDLEADLAAAARAGQSATRAQTTQTMQMTQTTQMGHTARVTRVPTGFPSPAEDMAEAPLSLDALLVRQPAATFFVEMSGNALLDSGIFAGDILVVDRSLYATYGAVVIVALDGTLTARHYCPDSQAIHLLPAHPDYAPINIGVDERERCQVWGVVTGVVRRMTGPQRLQQRAQRTRRS